MKIIDRYILGVFLRFFAMGAGLLVTLFVLILFFELIGDFVRYKAPVDLILRFFANKLPEAIYYMAPMAVLAASILTFSMMTKDRETMALMSGGVSAFRISLPLMFGAALISVMAFLDSEYLMPRSFARAEDIMRHKVKKMRDDSFVRQDKVWIKTANNDMWNIGFFDTAKNMLYDVSIIRFTRGLTGFDMIITAESAFQSAPSKWTFKKGIERKFDNGGAITESSFKEREYGFQLEARELKRAQKVPQEMNYYEISRYIERIKTAGYNDLRYTVEKYVKITFPLISVVMAFISIPFGLGIGSRASGAMAGVAVTALIGFVFWFLFSMSVSMGNSGKLPPLVSAGGAHLVFLFGAAYVMLSNRFERG